MVRILSERLVLATRHADRVDIGASGTGTSILGTFNVSDRALAELIPLSLFPGVTSSTHYVVRAHSTGRVTAPISPNTAQEFVTCSLDVQGYEIFSAFPLVAIQSNKYGEVSIANLGLLGKMTGCAAVISNRIERRSNGRLLIDTNIKAFGVLGKTYQVIFSPRGSV